MQVKPEYQIKILNRFEILESPEKITGSSEVDIIMSGKVSLIM
jgi:hypothetical protein